MTHTEDQPQPTPEPAQPAARSAVPAAPSADQLTATRATHWHQDGNPLLSLGDLRDWLNRSGLVLYAPRTQQLPAPAPSFVEATLGRPAPTPELAEVENARGLLTRLISEGAAVPLNLLGASGANGTDVPDFIVSAAVFSYIFTLRGNKAWKQPPVTSGPVKVSPLALAVYEALSAKVMLSSSDLAHHVGNQITEPAVLRALTELWSQLRVIPVPQVDGSATLWELSTSRFTKQIKAGANAGQPSALSALISLYLGQAAGATEDEIETFLSPLAPRSRVRDVTHALMGARQLETLVVSGKTLLHVAGDLPAFAAAVPPPATDAPTESGSRISTFKSNPAGKIASGLRSKPAFGKKPYGARAEGERRPFNRDARTPRPTFNKPWDEDRKPSPAAEGGETEAPRRTFTPRTDRPAFAAKPRFEARSQGFAGGSNAAGESRPPRRDFAPRPDGDAPRKTFSKPGTFGRKREGGFAGKPAFGAGDSRPPRRDFGSSDARPPRRDFAASAGRADRPASGEFKRPGSYAPRPRADFGGKPAFNGPKPGYRREGAPSQAGPGAGAGLGSGDAPRKVFRKFDAPRDRKAFAGKPFGDRKAFTPGGSARPPRSFDGPGSSDGPRSFNKPRPGGLDGPRPERSRGDRPSFGGSDRPRNDRPSFAGGSSDRPRSDRPRSDRPGFGARPAGGFEAKKPFAKPSTFAGKGGPFAKFADGAKPFRKPGQKRPPFTPKPFGSKPFGSKPGGFAPSKRKREDE